MSYQVLADIAFPFAGKYISQARFYLTKATELAPGRLDYRKELFDFLLHSAGSSRAAARQAADLLRAIPEPGPEYSYLHQEFERERPNCPLSVWTAVTACRQLPEYGLPSLACGSGVRLPCYLDSSR
jgi:hypothetical protein